MKTIHQIVKNSETFNLKYFKLISNKQFNTKLQRTERKDQ